MAHELTPKEVFEDLIDVFAEASGWSEFGYDIDREGKLTVERYGDDGDPVQTLTFTVTPKEEA